MIHEKSILVAFDTETTGLSAADGRIVEIAALKFDLDGTVLDKFVELINPGIPIPEVAFNIHHISDDMVADKPDASVILPRFAEFYAGEDNILIAQNSQFDIGFINYENMRYNLSLPRNTILDQIDFTRAAFPGLPTYSLERVCRRFNLVNSQSHRAMADSVLVMKLFLHCLKQYDTLDKALAVVNSLYHYSFGGPLVIPTDRALVDTLERALKDGATVEIIYAGGSLKGKPRLIRPTLMYNRDGMAFITARCLNSNSNKQFRLDRIIECRPVAEPNGR